MLIRKHRHQIGKDGKPLLGLSIRQVPGKDFRDGVENFVPALKRTAGTTGNNTREISFPFVFMVV